MSLVPALRRKKQVNFYEFTSLVYIAVPGQSGTHSETLTLEKKKNSSSNIQDYVIHNTV